jgi:hypothetical protein
VLGNEDRNQIYLNDGRGVFVVAPAGTLPAPAAPEETRDVEVFDANGDGRPDLFFANTQLWNPAAAPQNRLLLNLGPGPGGVPRFTDASARLPQRLENTMSALAIDLDGDGRTDLLLATIGDLRSADPAAPLRALRNRAGPDGPMFADESDTWLPAVRARGFDLTAIDADRDDRVDVFVSGRGGPDLLLRRRDGKARTLRR